MQPVCCTKFNITTYVVGRTLFVSFTVFGMDVEKLIDSVRSREILYKSNKKSYKDMGKKNKAWLEVDDEVGEGVTGWYSSILYPCNRHEWNETFGVPCIVFHVGSHLFLKYLCSM